MSNLIPGNQKHLTLEDRIYIEKALSHGESFKNIACFLCKDPTTISKEVKKHRLSDWYHKGTFIMPEISAYTDTIAARPMHATRSSSAASNALPSRPATRPAGISSGNGAAGWIKAPYVCNGCDKAVHKCTIAHKYVYNARFADRKYREFLSDCRSGISMTKKELLEKDRLVSHLIYQGQSPYQIVTNHPELDMSVRSLYTYIDKRLFTSMNVDLKRKPKFRPRKCHKTQITDREVFSGRRYSDFLMIDPDRISRAAKMDTVHSSMDSKRVLLTFYLGRKNCSLPT
ncbi:MAG: helix-turn-helix domain-containing protein [Roseburia sp.]|nr:helix-turn-helix domain-containing protein [Roseburia sp.]